MNASVLRKALATIGRRGGKARVAKLDKCQLAEEMRERARARWGNPERCPCGKMTLARAKKRRHRCELAA